MTNRPPSATHQVRSETAQHFERQREIMLLAQSPDIPDLARLAALKSVARFLDGLEKQIMKLFDVFDQLDRNRDQATAELAKLQRGVQRIEDEMADDSWKTGDYEPGF